MFSGSAAGCKTQTNLGCGLAWGGIAVIGIALLLAQWLTDPPSFSAVLDLGVPDMAAR